ncbi:MAG TPA: hypothetical protein VGG99_07565 [Acetobacteraceae bacterium]|jgi:hypothetical protein
MVEIEARLQRIEAELEALAPLRRLAAPAAPDLLNEWARVAMILLRSSAVLGTLCAVSGVPGDLARRWVMAAVGQPPDPELGKLTEQVMDALLLANGKAAGTA